MILNKYTSMPVGRALMVSDLGIVLVGAVSLRPATGLYCILGMILKSTVADSAIEKHQSAQGLHGGHLNPQPVRDFIVNDLHRSATMEQAEGAYTHDEKWVLTTVLTRGQAQEAPPACPRSGRPRLYHDCEQQRDRGQGLPGDLKNQSLPPGEGGPRGRMRRSPPRRPVKAVPPCRGRTCPALRGKAGSHLREAAGRACPAPTKQQPRYRAIAANPALISPFWTASPLRGGSLCIAPVLFWAGAFSVHTVVITP